MFEYSTALHIHSNYSDGSGSIPDIAKFASEVGLDIILMTDHNTLRAKDDGYERWFDHTLVLIGAELNDENNQNHYLAFNTDELPCKENSACFEYVNKTNELGGIGFIAHPFEKRNHMKEHPAYPWIAWDIRNFTGIEIWNHMSEWIEGLTEQNKYQRFIHPLKSIIAPVPEALSLWDKLSQDSLIVGVAGIDAHGHKFNLLGFFEVEIFPYKVLFKSLRTHILCTGELIKDDSKDIINYNKSIIYEAFKFGRVFFGNYSLGDFKGFRFFAESGQQLYQIGDIIPDSEPSMRLRVILPNSLATINLIKNGDLIDSIISAEASWNIINHGIYRVVVELDGKPWIFSNHIKFGNYKI